MEQTRNPAEEPRSGQDEQETLREQLTRMEETIEEQAALEQENRRLLKRQSFLLTAFALLAAALCAAMGMLLMRFNAISVQVTAACTQAEALLQPLQETLLQLDADELNQLTQTLPEVAEQLAAVDVDALNEVMQELPATLQAVEKLQQQVESISGFFDGFGGLFG